ncbi:MAG: thioredoxin family protein [Planctomycetota bacterium]|nr:thioredoxin family protein [Planctomycetota bacterium]
MRSRRRWSNRIKLFGAALVVGLLCPMAAAQEEVPKIYDEQADAKAEIARAVAKAKKDNKRVLVVYGGNWCHWCHKLHDAFKKNRSIARTLQFEYEVVRVDIGRFDKNLDIAEGYGAQIKSGVPYLTVLGGNGKVLTNQETGSLEKDGLHDPDLVGKFLDKWKAKPWDAEDVYQEALSRAKKEKKRLLLHLGAPW